MSTKKSPGASSGGPYTIQLDDALLEEALAAVDAHRVRPTVASPTLHAPNLPQPAEGHDVVLADSDEGDDGGVQIDLEDDGLSLSLDPGEEAPTAEPGLNLAAMAAEWERLVAELDQMRVERDLAHRRLEAEAKERVRQKERLARLVAQSEEFKLVQIRAEEARRVAEAELTRARDETRMANENITRVRERLRRAEEEARQFGHAPVVLGLLPVLENLERASQHVDSSPQRVAEGLVMIVEQFRTALARSGVTRVTAAPGTPFQPSVHEAVTHTPTHMQPPGSVLVELQAGYTLHGRLLQAARVAVAAPAAEPRKSSLAEGEVLAFPDEAAEPVDSAEYDAVQDLLDDTISTSG